jgi:hypothetical protein
LWKPYATAAAPLPTPCPQHSQLQCRCPYLRRPSSTLVSLPAVLPRSEKPPGQAFPFCNLRHKPKSQIFPATAACEAKLSPNRACFPRPPQKESGLLRIDVLQHLRHRLQLWAEQQNRVPLFFAPPLAPASEGPAFHSTARLFPPPENRPMPRIGLRGNHNSTLPTRCSKQRNVTAWSLQSCHHSQTGTRGTAQPVFSISSSPLLLA